MYSRILVVVFRRFSNVEMKIDKAAKSQALDGMGEKRPTFLVSILDVIQKAEVLCRSVNTNSMNPKHIPPEYSTNVTPH